MKILMAAEMREVDRRTIETAASARTVISQPAQRRRLMEEKLA